MKIHKTNEEPKELMRSDCSKCCGLCCTALFFSKLDGFPENKTAGKPCKNLNEDFTCKIHAQLENQKMKGCIGYDCFGAGQQVTQNIYHGQSWKTLKNQANEVFDVFVQVYHLYQIRYYLVEAMNLVIAEKFQDELVSLYQENVETCNKTPKEILAFDIEEYRQRVNHVLKQICELLSKQNQDDCKKKTTDFIGKSFKGNDMRGMDFSMKLLIAANFEGCCMQGSNFLGADTRDANFCNTDLRESVFLTQGQINAARGNKAAKLPRGLEYPVTWK